MTTQRPTASFSRFTRLARNGGIVAALLVAATVAPSSHASPGFWERMENRAKKLGTKIEKVVEKVEDKAEEAAAKLLQSAKSEFNKLPAAEFNHKYVLTVVDFKDPTGKIAKTESMNSALKIEVASNSTGFPGGIGKIVHDSLFASYPRFTFKVAFACADSDVLGRSDYANPNSIWYNVFLGYYEIDVPKSLWKRPFGYETADPNAALRYDDILRLGKADWNHFSNQLYGVPAAAIAPYDQMPASPTGTRQKVTVGAREWDLVDVPNMQVVGPYPGGQKYVDVDKLAGPIWRYIFGTFNKTVPGHKPFEGTSMQGRFYMSFKDEPNTVTGEPSYKTFMFGGTVNEAYPDKKENARFLGLQMDALKKVILGESGIGFAHSVGAGAGSPNVASASSTPLKLFWSGQRKDNFVTATAQGAADAAAAGYALVRTEGYVFANQVQGTIPLKTYWGRGRDNMATATAAGEGDAKSAGYSFVRVEGYIYEKQQPNTIPLKLYWSAERGDNMTLARAESEGAAKAAGYKFVRVEGYIPQGAAAPPSGPPAIPGKGPLAGW